MKWPNGGECLCPRAGRLPSPWKRGGRTRYSVETPIAALSRLPAVSQTHDWALKQDLPGPQVSLHERVFESPLFQMRTLSLGRWARGHRGGGRGRGRSQIGTSEWEVSKRKPLGARSGFQGVTQERVVTHMGVWVTGLLEAREPAGLSVAGISTLAQAGGAGGQCRMGRSGLRQAGGARGAHVTSKDSHPDPQVGMEASCYHLIQCFFFFPGKQDFFGEVCRFSGVDILCVSRAWAGFGCVGSSTPLLCKPLTSLGRRQEVVVGGRLCVGSLGLGSALPSWT